MELHHKILETKQKNEYELQYELEMEKWEKEQNNNIFIPAFSKNMLLEFVKLLDCPIYFLSDIKTDHDPLNRSYKLNSNLQKKVKYITFQELEIMEWIIKSDDQDDILNIYIETSYLKSLEEFRKNPQFDSNRPVANDISITTAGHSGNTFYILNNLCIEYPVDFYDKYVHLKDRISDSYLKLDKLKKWTMEMYECSLCCKGVIQNINQDRALNFNICRRCRSISSIKFIIYGNHYIIDQFQLLEDYIKNVNKIQKWWKKLSIFDWNISHS